MLYKNEGVTKQTKIRTVRSRRQRSQHREVKGICKLVTKDVPVRKSQQTQRAALQTSAGGWRDPEKTLPGGEKKSRDYLIYLTENCFTTGSVFRMN